MSARSQDTLWDQEGGDGDAVTDDQTGSPERLGYDLVYVGYNRRINLLD